MLVAGAGSASDTTSGGAKSGGDVDAFRAKLEKWVEAREILSKERADWLVEKEYLRSTQNLLAQEKKAIQAEIDEFKQLDAGASDERNEMLLKRADYQRAAESLETRIVELERQVLDLVPRLPEPLQTRLEPLLVQIPEDPERVEISNGQRLMNVLGVLAQAEKFNSTATLVGETRAVRGDQKVQIRTLYWGLGQAIYVDGQGQNAGVGRPTAEGWVFVDDPKLAEDAKLLLDIYEGNVDTISFIPIPVAIQ
jgi:hypothetical protein